MEGDNKNTEQAVHVPVDRIMLEGTLVMPPSPRGVVLFAHGSGSNRHSPRNQMVAAALQTGFATILLDLLTAKEDALDEQTAAMRFDIDLLAQRLKNATWWLKDQSATAQLPIGYFAASTAAAAALVAAAELSDLVMAIVSRGGRPDLAGEKLQQVISPTLLIVGAKDPQVLDLNTSALEAIPAAEKKLDIVAGATHLFDQPGTMEKVAELAKSWFEIYLAGERRRRVA